MARFYEQNIEVILEPGGFEKHIKELRFQNNIESVFVPSTTAAREHGIKEILEKAGYDPVIMWGEHYGDLQNLLMNKY